MAATAAALHWDGPGEKAYESGVDQGVLYKLNNTSHKWEGVAWNGLTSVTESPEGAELTDLYADNIKYASLRSAETFGGTIEAYTYPTDFEGCDGFKTLATGIVIAQQEREAFGLCYRTKIGNDSNPNAGYKYHLVYNCTCSPSEKAYETINDSPDAITMSWEFDSNPVNVTGSKPTSVLVIDSTKVAPEKMTLLLNALYGTDAGTGTEGTVPYLPMPDDVLDLIA